MIREILVITRDPLQFQQIEKACRLSCQNSVFTSAQTLRNAADNLRERHVALILLGQLARKERAASLLSYICKFYPDMPVLNMAGHRESIESLLVGEKGISVQTVDMLPAEKWPEIINHSFQMERNGGALYVSDISFFVQMVEQEQRTCTLRVYDEVNHQTGILFFQGGELINARLKTVQGKAAACEVLTWEAVWIDIQDNGELPTPRIDTHLQALLIEGRLNKDNQAADGDQSTPRAAAAREEETYYQAMIGHNRDDETPENTKTDVTEVEPPQAAPSGSRRVSVSLAAALLLLLLAITAFMANRYLNNPLSKKIWPDKNKTMSTIRLPAAKPLQKAVSSAHSKKPDRSTRGAIHSPKKKALKNDRTGKTRYQQQMEPADPLKPQLTSSPGTLAVFLHYTNKKNRAVTDQLADYLTDRGFAIRGVEQINYSKNEIRYFHPADLQGVKILYGNISAFLDTLHTPGAVSPFTLKDLSKTYLHVPRGQIEVWLRLAPTG